MPMVGVAAMAKGNIRDGEGEHRQGAGGLGWDGGRREAAVRPMPGGARQPAALTLH